MTTQHHAHASTQYLLPDLLPLLETIGQFLGCNAASLAVLDYDRWPNEYMSGESRDRAIGSNGSIAGLPLIQHHRLQRGGKRSNGVGVIYYESRLDPAIRYAVVTLKGAYDDESFLVVQKQNLFRLRRNVSRQNKDSGKAPEIPILPDGVLDEVVQNTIGFLLKAKEIEKYGVKIKRGLVLDGAPGNGKTMLCRYIQKLCSQNNIRWGTVTAADIDDAYSHKHLDELFQEHTVTFFDDIDVAYLNRGKGNGKMACSLLTAMDGMSQKGHLVRIFTTNEAISELDPAFTRPGRIDKCITLQNPTAELRKKLVETVWPEEIRQALNIEVLLGNSTGYSFAEMEAIRTLLVTNKTLGDGSWDLTKAFNEFESRRAENRRKGGSRVGFNS